MGLTGFLSSIYKNNIRDRITAVINSPRFSVDRSELETISNQCIAYGSYESYHPPLPIGCNSIPATLKKYNRELRISQPFVCEVSNAQLVGPDLIAITPDNRYILEETVAKPEMLTDAIARTLYHRSLPIRRRNTPIINQPVASLAGIQSHGYFHWFADYLPRVRGIEIYAESTGAVPDVIIPSDPPQWMEKSIQYIGIPDNRIIRWQDRRATANKLINPSVPRDTDDPLRVVYSPQALRWVGDRIKSNIKLDAPEENRVLITRRGATTRRIANEKEVINVLSPYGFEPVTLTELSFEDQVRLFAGAEAVIAPHGAGLINMIYSDQTRILELFGKFISPLYYCIAGGLGHTYGYTLADDTLATGTTSGIAVPGNDLVIDPENLKKTVLKWLDN